MADCFCTSAAPISAAKSTTTQFFWSNIAGGSSNLLVASPKLDARLNRAPSRSRLVRIGDMVSISVDSGELSGGRVACGAPA
eukprot:scaffold67728_cov28-Tisochrysis_lutea.AAC.5